MELPSIEEDQRGVVDVEKEHMKLVGVTNRVKWRQMISVWPPRRQQSVFILRVAHIYISRRRRIDKYKFTQRS